MAKSEDEKYFKCRFCDYKTLKFRRTRDGRVKSGWRYLHGHIEDNHPEEAGKIMLIGKKLK